MSEEKDVVFLTYSDGALARRLRNGGTVDLAVIVPYQQKPAWQSYTMPEFKKVEGRAPEATDYSFESVVLRQEPPLSAACLFPEPMNRGAALRGITAKGTCEAVFRSPRVLDGKTVQVSVPLRVTVCLAKVSAYSDKAEPGREIHFLTESDGALAKRLRETGKVDVAVIQPYRHNVRPCTLSEFKKIEGRAPQGTDYFIEGIRLRRRPAPASVAYVPDPMHLGATLKEITAKGTCEAILRSPALPEKTITVTVCVAKISAYSPTVELGD